MDIKEGDIFYSFNGIIFRPTTDFDPYKDHISWKDIMWWYCNGHWYGPTKRKEEMELRIKVKKINY